MTYQVVFQRAGRERETLYWNGSLDETQRLARTIASEWESDRFLIVEFDGSEAGSARNDSRSAERRAIPARRGRLAVCSAASSSSRAT